VQRVADLVVEVDDRVAAHDEVVGARARLDAQQVADLEAADGAQRGQRLVAAVGELLEAGGHELRGDGARVRGAEHALAGALDHAAVDVDARDRDVRPRHDPLGDGGEREGLRAVGAAGAPCTDAPGPCELGQHVLGEHLELLGVAPELGDVDRDAVEELLELAAVAAQDREVRVEAGVAARVDERADAPLHLAALVLQEVDRADAADALAERDVVVTRGALGDRLQAHERASRTTAAGRSSRPWTASARPASATARGMP
jgi:hypothetical protein